MYRKMMALLIAAALIAIAGCGGSGPAAKEEPKPSTPAPKDPVTIEFWHGMGPESAHGKTLNKLIDEFNASQKEVIVKGVHQGSYRDLDKKVTATIAAQQDIPAVVQFTDSMMTTLAKANQLVDLNKYLNETTVGWSKAEKDDFPAAFLEAMTINGKLQALPFNRSAVFLVYRKDLVAKPPANWAELRDVARKATVKGADGQVKTYGLVFEANGWHFANFFPQAGGEWISADGKKAPWNSQAGVDALTLIVDLVKDGSAIQMKPREYSSDYFNRGQAAMIMPTSASLAYIKPTDPNMKWGVAPIPAGAKNGNSGIAGGSLGIMAGAKPEHQEAGWKLIKYLTSSQVTLKWATAKTGYLPLRPSAVASNEWKEFVKANPEYEVFGTQLTKGTFMPNHPKWGAAMRHLHTAVEEAVLGKATPKAALDKAVKAAEEELNK